MKYESGRSLIEMMGVLAIMGVLTGTVLVTYNALRTRTTRSIAEQSLKEIATNTKMLFANRGDYTGVSVDYLIKSGALKDFRAPIGGTNWDVKSSLDGNEFEIILTELSDGDCNYFSLKKMDWANKITINGIELTNDAYCMSGRTNTIIFNVK